MSNKVRNGPRPGPKSKTKVFNIVHTTRKSQILEKDPLAPDVPPKRLTRQSNHGNATKATNSNSMPDIIFLDVEDDVSFADYDWDVPIITNTYSTAAAVPNPPKTPKPPKISAQELEGLGAIERELEATLFNSEEENLFFPIVMNVTGAGGGNGAEGSSVEKAESPEGEAAPPPPAAKSPTPPRRSPTPEPEPPAIGLCDGCGTFFTGEEVGESLDDHLCAGAILCQECGDELNGRVEFLSHICDEAKFIPPPRPTPPPFLAPPLPPLNLSLDSPEFPILEKEGEGQSEGQGEEEEQKEKGEVVGEGESLKTPEKGKVEKVEAEVGSGSAKRKRRRRRRVIMKDSGSEGEDSGSDPDWDLGSEVPSSISSPANFRPKRERISTKSFQLMVKSDEEGETEQIPEETPIKKSKRGRKPKNKDAVGAVTTEIGANVQKEEVINADVEKEAAIEENASESAKVEENLEDDAKSKPKRPKMSLKVEKADQSIDDEAKIHDKTQENRKVEENSEEKVKPKLKRGRKSKKNVSADEKEVKANSPENKKAIEEEENNAKPLPTIASTEKEANPEQSAKPEENSQKKPKPNLKRPRISNKTPKIQSEASANGEKDPNLPRPKAKAKRAQSAIPIPIKVEQSTQILPLPPIIPLNPVKNEEVAVAAVEKIEESAPNPEPKAKRARVSTKSVKVDAEIGEKEAIVGIPLPSSDEEVKINKNSGQNMEATNSETKPKAKRARFSPKNLREFELGDKIGNVVESKTLDGEFHCEIENCVKTFGSYRALKIHHTKSHQQQTLTQNSPIVKVEQEQEFGCEFENCGKSFPSKNSLYIHLCLHQNQEPSTSETVGDQEQEESQIQIQDLTPAQFAIVEQLQSERHVCPFVNCDKSFAIYRSLQIHIAKIHQAAEAEAESAVETEPEEFPCGFENCAKSFGSKRARNIHLYWHQRAGAGNVGVGEQVPGVNSPIVEGPPEPEAEVFICKWKNCRKRFGMKRSLNMHFAWHRRKSEGNAVGAVAVADPEVEEQESPMDLSI